MRVYEFHRPVGIGPEGGGYQTQVRVSMNAFGRSMEHHTVQFLLGLYRLDCQPMADTSNLTEVIAKRYGSLNKPDFSWVADAYHSDPAKEVRERLEKRLVLSEVTDLNSDVSVAYELGMDAGLPARWTIRVSLVGPYAAFIRHTPEEPSAMLVNGPADCIDPVEQYVQGVLSASGIELLDGRLLSATVPLRLFDTAPERVEVYQALFTDNDFLPGEYEALHLDLPGV